MLWTAARAEARPGGPAPEAEQGGAYVALAWGTGEEPRYVPVAPSRAVPATRAVGERLELRRGTGEEPRLVPVGAER